MQAMQQAAVAHAINAAFLDIMQETALMAKAARQRICQHPNC